MANIMSFWGVDANAQFSSPATNWNGGGYSQPMGGCLVSSPAGEIMVSYMDTSCGDFGRRISWAAQAGETKWSWAEGDMDLTAEEIAAQDQQAAEVMQDLAETLGLSMADLNDLLADVKRAVCAAAGGWVAQAINRKPRRTGRRLRDALRA